MPKPGKRFKDSKEHKYGDFRGGGLNLSASEFYLKENEYAACKNTCYERNGGRLRTLEPLDLVYTAAASVTSIFNSLAYGLFYVCGQSLYKFTNGVAAYLGELNGTETPKRQTEKFISRPAQLYNITTGAACILRRLSQ